MLLLIYSVGCCCHRIASTGVHCSNELEQNQVKCLSLRCNILTNLGLELQNIGLKELCFDHVLDHVLTMFQTSCLKELFKARCFVWDCGIGLS